MCSIERLQGRPVLKLDYESRVCESSNEICGEKRLDKVSKVIHFSSHILKNQLNVAKDLARLCFVGIIAAVYHFAVSTLVYFVH